MNLIESNKMISYKELEWIIDHFHFNKDHTFINYKVQDMTPSLIISDRHATIYITSEYVENVNDSDYEVEIRWITIFNHADTTYSKINLDKYLGKSDIPGIHAIRRKR